VRVRLLGEALPQATLLPRAAIRPGGVVWVVDQEGRVSIRPVELARVQDEKVLVKGGLAQGERVVTTSLKAVTEGMRVRLEAEPRDNAPDEGRAGENAS
jgi:multidrug efflux pump subunit AcrA (membrane-fusion protein)